MIGMRCRKCIVVSLAMLCACCASTPPAVMSFEAYRNVEHNFPYVIETTAWPGRLIYYGANHVYAADHPEIEDIQTRWAQFRPTYALNEGGAPPVFESLQETVGRNGESALVRWLARRDGVPVETLDPTRADSVAAMRSRFTPEQFKLSSILGQVAEQRRRSDSFQVQDVDAEVMRFMNVLSRTPGLEGPPRTLQELQDSATRLLPALVNWREVPSSWFDPAVFPAITWTNELSRFNNEYRDEFMIQKIIAKLGEGHRVFAVVGGTHVVMQERSLRWRIQRQAAKPN
jgi:hypothetical protein